MIPTRSGRQQATRRSVVLVVDERLTAPGSRIRPGAFGDEVEIVIPASFDAAGLAPHLPGAVVILTAHRPVTSEMMDAAPGLRLIAKGGTGVDNIDVTAAARRGIVVTNAPGVRAQAVAEHATFLMLALARRAWMMGDSGWRFPKALQLYGHTLGIVGFGAIGTRLAPIGRGLGMELMVHTRTPRPESHPGIEFCGLDRLLPRADVVVLCASLTAETRGMIDRAAIDRMRADALLINVGRGPLIVTDELVAALREGKLGGVGLDVTDPEPLPSDHPLRSMPRVILTPHNAGRTSQADADGFERLRSNVLAVLAGEKPLDPVPPTAPLFR